MPVGMGRRILTDERGVALVLALVTMLVLSSLTAAVLTSIAVNQRSSMRSSESSRAFALAEEGIAYAEGRLYSAPVAGLTNGSTVPATTSEKGWDYSGSYNSTSSTWTLTGHGTYDGVRRTIVIQVPVNFQTQTTTVSETAVYNYLFANSTTTCVTLSGNGAVTVPLYTRGCVYLVDHTMFNGNDLEVGNYLQLGPNAGVGAATQKIGTLNVVNGCRTSVGAPFSCGTGSTSPIYANSVGTTLTPPGLQKPTIVLQEQTPTCGAGSTGVPSGFFDTDSTLNNPTRSVSLFPAGFAYDCKIDANDELKWDGSKNFTVKGGPYYFDGSLSMSGTQQVIYTGSAAIFFTGKIAMSGQAWICGSTGVTSTTSHGSTSYTCNSQWDPAGTRSGGVTNEIVMVAGCWADTTGSSFITYSGSGTYCVDLSGQNTLQVGTVLNTDYHSGGNASNLGPVIADTLTIGGNPGQLMPFSSLPAGAPTTVSTSSTTTVAGKPRNWNG